MNPYEQFFRLLWSLMGMVVGGKATIEWLNDCFEIILSSPKASRAEIVLPPKSPKPIHKGQKRMTRSFKLEPQDWQNLSQFCEQKGQGRYRSLVEYYRRNNNKPTPYRELQRMGLAGDAPGSFQSLLCIRLVKAGFNNYAFKGSVHGGSAPDQPVCFAIVE